MVNSRRQFMATTATAAASTLLPNVSAKEDKFKAEVNVFSGHVPMAVIEDQTIRASTIPYEPSEVGATEDHSLWVYDCNVIGTLEVYKHNWDQFHFCYNDLYPTEDNPDLDIDDTPSRSPM